MVNGPAMILAIANNIFHFVGAEAMRRRTDDFWRSAEVLVGNRQQALRKLSLTYLFEGKQ